MDATGTEDDLRLLLLSPADNVLVARQELPAGTVLRLAGNEVALPATVGRGHKLARRAMAAGERVLKYGAPIGVATRRIALGEHVHVHNIRSEYTATHLIGHPSEDAAP